MVLRPFKEKPQPCRPIIFFHDMQVGGFLMVSNRLLSNRRGNSVFFRVLHWTKYSTPSNDAALVLELHAVIGIWIHAVIGRWIQDPSIHSVFHLVHVFLGFVPLACHSHPRPVRKAMIGSRERRRVLAALDLGDADGHCAANQSSTPGMSRSCMSCRRVRLDCTAFCSTWYICLLTFEV